MNKLFKYIRHSDIDAVQAALSKNIAVVNEVYTAKAPKKDIGQSPLQVAIKCGEFEIVELLLENGADPNFMENPELVPPGSSCMPVLHDAIRYAFDTLCYEQYIYSRKYVNLVETLLKKGANPNRKTSSKLRPIDAAVHSAEFILDSKSAYPSIQELTRNTLFEILDLLIKYGASMEEWLNQNFWGVSNKAHYFEEKLLGANDVDIREPIRLALQEYLDKF